MMAAGTRLGAKSAVQRGGVSNPAIAPARVGTSGIRLKRESASTAMSFTFPAFIKGRASAEMANDSCRAPDAASATGVVL